MPARWLLPALVALALPAVAAAQTPPPEQSPQALFGGLILNDPRTAADVRAVLSAGAAFVGLPQFVDLTGDGRMDAVVQVRVPGAAGTVAVYAFSTDGASGGQLRAILRSQALYRATVEVAPATLLITVPDYGEGDDVCCPSARSGRRYAWDAKARRLRRR
jgi:hypothetical protein